MIEFLKAVLLTIILIYNIIFITTAIVAIKDDCIHNKGVRIFLGAIFLLIGYLSAGYVFS